MQALVTSMLTRRDSGVPLQVYTCTRLQRASRGPPYTGALYRRIMQARGYAGGHATPPIYILIYIHFRNRQMLSSQGGTSKVFGGLARIQVGTSKDSKVPLEGRTRNMSIIYIDLLIGLEECVYSTYIYSLYQGLTKEVIIVLQKLFIHLSSYLFLSLA